MPVHADLQFLVRRLTDPDQPLLEEMYATFEPLSEALGLPPKEADALEVFLNVQNLLNTPPPFIANPEASFFNGAAASAAAYDVIGREVFVGVRFKL